jgi:hypothetical protein
VQLLFEEQVPRPLQTGGYVDVSPLQETVQGSNPLEQVAHVNAERQFPFVKQMLVLVILFMKVLSISPSHLRMSVENEI